MILTPRDMLILESLARYYLLNRRQLQQRCFPEDIDGRVCRRRLVALSDAGMIRRHNAFVASRYDQYPAPVYLLSQAGRTHLARHTGDGRYLHKPTKLPHPLHVVHQLAVAEVHLALEAAIAAQTGVLLEAWYNEADVVNADEPDHFRHYRLRTQIEGQPAIICMPDAGFLLNRGGWRTAIYLELERGDGDRGTGARQLADRKCPGYAELARRQLHLKHFPTAKTDRFCVLLIAPHHQRRDAIRRAFRQKDPTTFRTDLWRFAAMAELTAETFLRARIFYPCEDLAAEPLVRL
jgi:hypothetical protein